MTREETHEALKQYRQRHEACPVCGGISVRHHMVGYAMQDPVTYRDENQAACNDCGWTGIVHDLVQWIDPSKPGLCIQTPECNLRPMRVFIIGPVRGADESLRENLEAYTRMLEDLGCQVHLPHRDTKQDARGLDICRQNRNAIERADEVHVFYSSTSTGSHFDLGVAFALNKRILVVKNEPYGEGKSFPRMLDEWEKAGPVDQGPEQEAWESMRQEVDRQMLSDLLGKPGDPKVSDAVAECLKQDIDRLPSDTRLASDVLSAFHEEEHDVEPRV